MASLRRWRITAACFSLLLAIAAIYIVVLQRRVERATAWAYAGMSSVRYVCSVVAIRIRTLPPEDRSSIVAVADACTAMPDEIDGRRAEIIAGDYRSLALRIERLMDDRQLPIWGSRQPPRVEPGGLPKGLRE